MIIKALELEAGADETTFADNGSIAAWAKGSVATAVKEGILSGYPGNVFNPQGQATRAEAVTVIVNALAKK